MRRLFVTALVVALLSLPTLAWGANWTVMIYMAADNDLEPYAISDFLELSSVGSSSSVNILVQLDRGGWGSKLWMVDDNSQIPHNQRYDAHAR